MTKAAEDFEKIARRLKELEAEKQEALTGSSASVRDEVKSVESVYGIYGDYACGYRLSPAAYNEAVRNYMRVKADCEALTSKPSFGKLGTKSASQWEAEFEKLPSPPGL